MTRLEKIAMLKTLKGGQDNGELRVTRGSFMSPTMSSSKKITQDAGNPLLRQGRPQSRSSSIASAGLNKKKSLGASASAS